MVIDCLAGDSSPMAYNDVMAIVKNSVAKSEKSITFTA
jgi:hypothetical protein